MSWNLYQKCKQTIWLDKLIGHGISTIDTIKSDNVLEFDQKCKQTIWLDKLIGHGISTIDTIK